jgi:hypothetical protein
MRFFIVATLFASFTGFPQNGTPQSEPDWTSSCNELTIQANGANSAIPIRGPKSIQFADYPAHPVAPKRPYEAVISKYDVIEKKKFAQVVREVVSEGPDFAGRYALVTWGCGTWCWNVVIADVVAGRVYDAPFAAAIGFAEVTPGELIQRRADSSLLVVSGCLEMRNGQQLKAGPCGTFHFNWSANHLRLIGCEMKDPRPQ